MFHTVSLKISNSFCIRDTMMKAKSNLPKICMLLFSCNVIHVECVCVCVGGGGGG